MDELGISPQKLPFTTFGLRAIVLAPQTLKLPRTPMEITSMQSSPGAKPALQASLARGQPVDQHQVRNSPAVPADLPRTWWVHVYSGLVRDPSGKHHNAMGNAVWLYLYLLISANRMDGTVLRKQETIALQTGLTERTVARQLQDLRDNGYITSINNGRSLRILITKWRPIIGSRSKQN